MKTTASARIVHLEVHGDDAFVAGVASAVSSLLSNLTAQSAPPAKRPAKPKKARAAAPGTASPRRVRVTKGAA